MTYLEQLHKKHLERQGRLAKAGLEQKRRERLRNETAKERLSREIAELLPELKFAPIKPKKITKSVASIAAIQYATATFYNITRGDILSPSRIASLTLPRAASMYIAQELTGLSHRLIARETGNRDHSSSVRAQKVISEELARGNEELATKIEAIKVKLKEGSVE